MYKEQDLKQDYNKNTISSAKIKQRKKETRKYREKQQASQSSESDREVFSLIIQSLLAL